MRNLKLKKRSQEAVMLLDLNKRFIHWIYDNNVNFRIMFFSNLMNALFGTNSRPDYEPTIQEVAAPVVEKKVSPSVSPKPSSGRFDADVESLKKKWGTFETGLCITENLQDLLTICPRNRPRVDAYQGLVSHLKSEYGVTLTIKSRKRK